MCFSDLSYADIEDNCKQHGVRGRLDHERIQEIINDYDPDEMEARAHGQFLFLSGRIYKCFDPKIHIVDPFEIPVNVNFYQINDPHDRKYPALSWIFLTDDEKAFIYDEWPEEPYEYLKSCPYTIEEICEIIKSKEGNVGFIRIMDPNIGMKTNQFTRKTVIQEYWKHGIKYRPGADDMALGHKAVRDMLKNKKLFIFRNCRNHWHFMQRYSWKDWQGKTAEGRSISENVGEKFKDFSDNIRYFALGFPRYKKPIQEKKEPTKMDEHREGHKRAQQMLQQRERDFVKYKDVRGIV